MAEARRNKRKADNIEKKAKVKGVKTPAQLAEEARRKEYHETYNVARHKIEEEKSETGALKYIDVRYPADLKEIQISPQSFTTLLLNNSQIMRLNVERERLKAEIDKIDGLIAQYVQSTDFVLITNHIRLVDQGVTEEVKRENDGAESE